jgi:hypothetical protein
LVVVIKAAVLLASGAHQLVAPACRVEAARRRKSDECGTRLAWWERVCAGNLAASIRVRRRLTIGDFNQLILNSTLWNGLGLVFLAGRV